MHQPNTQGRTLDQMAYFDYWQLIPEIRNSTHFKHTKHRILSIFDRHSTLLRVTGISTKLKSPECVSGQDLSQTLEQTPAPLCVGYSCPSGTEKKLGSFSNFMSNADLQVSIFLITSNSKNSKSSERGTTLNLLLAEAIFFQRLRHQIPSGYTDTASLSKALD